MAGFNVKTTQISIGSLVIEPSGSAAAVSVSPLTDLGSTIDGVNGDAVFSANNSETMVMTITMLESSDNARDMMDQIHVQRAQLQTANVGRAGLRVRVYDVNGGESLTSPEAYYQQIPTLEKGQAATDRVFVLHLLHAKRTLRVGRKPTSLIP